MTRTGECSAKMVCVNYCSTVFVTLQLLQIIYGFELLLKI